MRFAETWEWVSTSPLFALTLTVGIYWAADKLWERSGRNPLLTPLLVAAGVIGAVLVLLGIYPQPALDTAQASVQGVRQWLGTAITQLASIR